MWGKDLKKWLIITVIYTDMCKMAKTVDVVTTDTSVRFTSLLTKIAETITTGTRNTQKKGTSNTRVIENISI